MSGDWSTRRWPKAATILARSELTRAACRRRSERALAEIRVGQHRLQDPPFCERNTKNVFVRMAEEGAVAYVNSVMADSGESLSDSRARHSSIKSFTPG